MRVFDVAKPEARFDRRINAVGAVLHVHAKGRDDEVRSFLIILICKCVRKEYNNNNNIKLESNEMFMPGVVSRMGRRADEKIMLKPLILKNSIT